MNEICVVLLLQYEYIVLFNAILMVSMCKITTFICFLKKMHNVLLLYENYL